MNINDDAAIAFTDFTDADGAKCSVECGVCGGDGVPCCDTAAGRFVEYKRRVPTVGR